MLDTETEPGVAIAWALSVPHPLCVEVDLDPAVTACINALASDLPGVVSRRLLALQFWEARAAALLPSSEALMRSIEDPALRRLLRGTTDDQPHASLALVAILRSSTRRSRPASRSTPSCQIFCSMVSRLLGQSPARGVGQYLFRQLWTEPGTCARRSSIESEQFQLVTISRKSGVPRSRMLRRAPLLDRSLTLTAGV